MLRAAQCDSLDSSHKVHFKKVDALAARAVASIKGHEGYAAMGNESDLFAEQVRDSNGLPIPFYILTYVLCFLKKKIKKLKVF
jgi:hypothetical protein